MIIAGIVIFIILAIVGFSWAEASYESGPAILGVVSVLVVIFLFGFGCFHGFINYPKTSGTHTGVISAVDLEGIWFRRHEVYLKTSQLTGQDDETKYCIYEYESELAEQLRNAVGKQVKLTYGHDGGYIGWKSCGTYHIKSVEVIEEVEKND